MQLIVMRHGQAEPIAASDAQRNLTEKGRQDVAAMAATLAQHISSPVRLLYSPYLRTTQTANIVGEHLNETGLLDLQNHFVADDAVVSGAQLNAVLSWLDSTIEALSEEGKSNPPDLPMSLMLVSHQPLVSRLVGWLVYGAEGNALAEYPEAGMAPSSAAVLELDAVAKGAAQLKVMLHEG